MPRLAALASLFAATLAAATILPACASETDDGADEPASDADSALATKADEHWLYTGAMPTLANPTITVSLKGHTVHVTGYAPEGTPLPMDLKHFRARPENGRLRLDVVYPIATARPGKSNSRPGTYRLEYVKPYRPDGNAFTIAEGDHFVPWGGFPFFAYNGGIAFHGPISPEASGRNWYLQRGPVSGGCNRMLGEHIVEFTHILGVSMRKIYDPDRFVAPAARAPVTVIEDYDQIDGKFIDVDYPTHGAAVRPAKDNGPEKVEMFGSWVAAEQPDGSDLPPDMQWEGGIRGKWYKFREHAFLGVVCSVPKDVLLKTREIARLKGGELPRTFCSKRDCIVDTLRSGRSASQAMQVCQL